MESKIESGLDEFKIALDQIEFRVKTEQEFINEFGEKWDGVIDPGWDDAMNEFFGKVIEDEYKLDCFKTVIGITDRFRMRSNEFNDESWTFDKSMITYEIIET